MKYFLYCRKSTEESAGKQLNSLESQEQAMLQIAERENLEVVKTYRESQSASKLGRPVLEQLLSDIESGKADGILCWKLDRLARNMVEGGAIFQMIQDGVIKQIKCYDKEYDQSTNAIVFGVELGQATQYSVELKANVNRGMMFKFRNGDWPTAAPVGYLNHQESAHKRYIITDTDKAPLIRHMFEEYATGQYSLKQISDYIYTKGLVSKVGKKLVLHKITNILDSSFYYGLMKFKDEEQMGNHEPIISKELFGKVQDIRQGRNRPRPQKHMFPYRGVFQCESCNSSLTTDFKKGLYRYYRCTGGKNPDCPQKKINIREEVLDKYISDNFAQIDFDEELIEIMYKASLEDLERDTEQNTSICDGFEKELEQLESKKSELLEMRINKELTPEEYAKEKTKYNQDIKDCENRIKNTQKRIDPKTTIELTRKAFLDSNRLKKRFVNANDEQKHTIVSEALSNSQKSTVQGRESVTLQYKSPFDIIAGASVSSDYGHMWT